MENLGFYSLSAVAFDVIRGIGWALTISFPFVQDSLAAGITFMNDTIASRPYSRKLEYEADKLSLEVGGPLSCWRKLIQLLSRSWVELAMIRVLASSSGVC